MYDHRGIAAVAHVSRETVIGWSDEIYSLVR